MSSGATPPPTSWPTLLCRILLEGLAAGHRPTHDLDRSAAFIAADEAIEVMDRRCDADASDKAAHVRAVARAEFGRRGLRGHHHQGHRVGGRTRHRHGYRLIGSKDELLASIMQSFGEKVAEGWTRVLRSDSSPIEKLDALSWVNTNVLDRFGDEFRIQLAWMRQSPPDTPNTGWLFAKRLRQMKTLLAEGIRSGEIAIDTPRERDAGTVVIGVGWIPENILHDLGTRRSLIHAARHRAIAA